MITEEINIEEILIEGLKQQGEIYNKSTSWLDDEDWVKTNENTYYNEEEDYFVIVSSLHSFDEVDWDEEIDGETKQIFIEDLIDCVRSENEIDDDYSSFEIVRKHLKTDGLWMSDYYYQWGLGEIHLKKQ